MIAPVVSMFFLISYGLLNYATYFEARGADPSFRPRFRFFDKRLSLLAALGCLGVMLAINPIAGGVAVAALLGIRFYLQRSDRPDRWTDASADWWAADVVFDEEDVLVGGVAPPGVTTGLVLALDDAGAVAWRTWEFFVGAPEPGLVTTGGRWLETSLSTHAI